MSADEPAWEWVEAVQACTAPAWAQAAYGQPEPAAQDNLQPPPEPCTAPAWAQREYVQTTTEGRL